MCYGLEKHRAMATAHYDYHYKIDLEFGELQKLSVDRLRGLVETLDPYLSKKSILHLFVNLIHRGDVSLLELACKTVKPKEEDMLAIVNEDIAACLRSGNALTFMNEKFWKGLKTSFVIGHMFIMGFDIQAVERAERILGPVHSNTCYIILFASSTRSPNFKCNYFDAVKWAWPRVWPHEHSNHNSEHTYEKNYVLFRAALSGDQEVVDWILTNGAVTPTKYKKIEDDFKSAKETDRELRAKGYNFTRANLHLAAAIFGLS